VLVDRTCKFYINDKTCDALTKMDDCSKCKFKKQLPGDALESILKAYRKAKNKARRKNYCTINKNGELKNE